MTLTSPSRSLRRRIRRFSRPGWCCSPVTRSSSSLGPRFSWSGAREWAPARGPLRRGRSTRGRLRYCSMTVSPSSTSTPRSIRSCSAVAGRPGMSTRERCSGRLCSTRWRTVTMGREAVPWTSLSGTTGSRSRAQGGFPGRSPWTTYASSTTRGTVESCVL